MADELLSTWLISIAIRAAPLFHQGAGADDLAVDRHAVTIEMTSAIMPPWCG
jgi:hypothetical protein